MQNSSKKFVLASLHGQNLKSTFQNHKWDNLVPTHLFEFKVALARLTNIFRNYKSDNLINPCREANTNFLLLNCILYVLIRSHWINLIKIFYILHILSYKIKKIWTNSIQPFVSNKLSKLPMLIRSSPIIFKVLRDRKYLITPACSAWKVL